MSARDLPPPAASGPLLPWLLVALAPTNRTRVKQLLRHRQVHVNGVPVTRHDHPLKPGDRVSIGDGRRARGVRPGSHPTLPVVYEDEAVVVVDKPDGLLTVATDAEKHDTAFVRATAQFGRVYVVHRLDRETSGLLLFARSAEARDRLQAGWDAAEKTYQVVAEGTPRPAEGVIDNYLAEMNNLRVRAVPADAPGARRAVSRYRVVEAGRRYSLVGVVIETGRKHQIRVHMAGLGCPVIGDQAYRAKSDPAGRLGLYAHRLAFPHPTTGERVEVESPLPPVLRKTLAR
ncbi:MAG: RluA family pseudouridine synthase [Gemmataceae bacterium]|nr:RluA family pseudouridine synthase [Gemmataceae bacterium]